MLEVLQSQISYKNERRDNNKPSGGSQINIIILNNPISYSQR